MYLLRTSGGIFYRNCLTLVPVGVKMYHICYTLLHQAIDNHQLLIALQQSSVVENLDFCVLHLHSTPLLGGSLWNIAQCLVLEKLEWFGYPMPKII